MTVTIVIRMLIVISFDWHGKPVSSMPFWIVGKMVMSLQIVSVSGRDYFVR